MNEEALYLISDRGSLHVIYNSVAFGRSENENAEYNILMNDGYISRNHCIIYQNKQGMWIIQIRDNFGHGMRINLDIDKNLYLKKSLKKTSSGLQKIFMAICVVWGFIGTTLFFKRSRKF